MKKRKEDTLSSSIISISKAMFAQYTSEKDKHKDNDNQSKAKLQPVCFSLWENTLRVLSSDSSIDDNTCDETPCQNPWLLAVHFAHHRNVQLWAKTNIGTWFMYEAKWGTQRMAMFLTRKRSRRTRGHSHRAFQNYYEIGRRPAALGEALYFRPPKCLQVNKRAPEDQENNNF